MTSDSDCPHLRNGKTTDRHSFAPHGYGDSWLDFMTQQLLENLGLALRYYYTGERAMWEMTYHTLLGENHQAQMRFRLP
jgi:hypothetical protein